MTKTAQHLKGKVAFVHPLRYKLEGGWVWALSGTNQIMTKMYYAGNVDKISVINQHFGENATSFYAQLGLLGHNGIDWYGKPGTCLYAVSDGVIKSVNDPEGSTTYNPQTWGYVELEGEQNEIKYRYFYGHIADALVSVGQKVRANDLVALLGNTGKYTTGPHCHTSFLELDKSDAVLNLNNGFHGAIDDEMLYEDLFIYKTDDLKKLYDYAKARGDQFTYYFGLGGGERFEIAKAKLGVIGATRSQYYNYLIKNLFKL